MSDFKILKTKRDYNAAVNRAIQIFDAQPGDAKFDELEILGRLIKNYEDRHYVIAFEKIRTILPL